MAIPSEDQSAAWCAVVRTASVIRLEVADVLRRFGLTDSSWNVLSALLANRAPLTTGELNGLIAPVGSDVTRLVDRLIRDEYVVRERCEQDRRVVRVRIATGQRVQLRKVQRQVAAVQSRLFANFSDRELRTLLRLLTKLEPS